MKFSNKVGSALLASLMAASMCVPAMAANAPAAGLTGGASENTIPVKITAEATTFDVTVPTAFPLAMTAGGVVTAADNVKIVNNSYGAIIVTKIDAAGGPGAADADLWKLAAFSKDMTQEKVDSNQIGLQVKPSGGKASTGVGAGTALVTDDSSTTAQTLLSERKAEWVLDGKDATSDGGKDELAVEYAGNASSVSKTTNKAVANLIFTVAWHDGAAV